MGSGSSAPEKSAAEAGSKPEASAASGCPIRSKPAESSEGCPVPNASGMLRKYRNADVYNVYSQKIDPANQMPAQANQQRAPGQAKQLSTERVSSSIPKGGTDGTWTYPSPQMFYNAIVRKGKKGSTSEDDMETVVAIHNNMNERTWDQVMAWEKMHMEADAEEKGTSPKLLRFLGRPDELSLLARLKIFFGHPAPFDRHDWVVDRGGKEVRYIIDYYHDVSKADDDQMPALRSHDAVKSIVLDVRPALDSPEAFIDRYLRMPLEILQSRTTYSPAPFFASQAMVEADRREKDELAKAEEQRRAIAEASQGNRLPAPISQSCGPLMKLVQDCRGEEQCTERLVGFQLCVARIVAPDAAKLFEDAYKRDDAEAMQANYEMMSARTSQWLHEYRTKEG